MGPIACMTQGAGIVPEGLIIVETITPSSAVL